MNGDATGESDAVLSVVDDVSTWQPGDKIVIASSDYDMNHAEVFTLVRCPSCTANQVKLNGQYSMCLHVGDVAAADALFFLSFLLLIPLSSRNLRSLLLL